MSRSNKSLESTFQNKKFFLWYLYTLPLECRTYRYLAKYFKCDIEIIKEKVKELGMERKMIHSINDNIPDLYLNQYKYIESYLLKDSNNSKYIYKNVEIYGKRDRKYYIDFVFDSSIETETNFIIQFPTKTDEKKINFIKDSSQKDFTNKTIYISDNDFIDIFSLQKLKYKLCKLSNINFTIYEDKINDTNNLLHIFDLHKTMKESYKNYLYINMLQDNIIQSIKNEMKYIELGYDKIIDNISNYNNEIYNSQMKIRPLIKRINRRF